MTIQAERTGVITPDGVRLHVETTGSPDAPVTVVLVHGWTCSTRSWHHQLSGLPEVLGPSAVRVVAYDHRGHGRSEAAPVGSTRISQLADDLVAVLDSVVGDGPVVYAGHSMGGMTLMALADERPELFGSRIKAAALVSTSSGQISSRPFGLPARFDGAAAVVAPRAMNLAGQRMERRALRRTASRGASDTRVGDAGVGDARLADARVGDAGVGDARVVDARVGDAGVGDARVADARVGDAGVGDARVADARVGDAEVVDAEVAGEVAGSRQRAVRALVRDLGPVLRRPAVRQLVFGKKVDPAEVDILLADLAATPGRSYSGFFEAISQHDLGHALEVLSDIPVEIMHGTRDRLLPPRHANRMAQLLPSARLWMYPGAGHMLMQERPRDVTHRLASLARKVRES